MYFYVFLCSNLSLVFRTIMFVYVLIRRSMVPLQSVAFRALSLCSVGLCSNLSLVFRTIMFVYVMIRRSMVPLQSVAFRRLLLCSVGCSVAFREIPFDVDHIPFHSVVKFPLYSVRLCSKLFQPHF